jgi:hypothetical protein
VSIVDLAAERHRRLPEYDGILCECGSAWFNARVALNPIGFVWSSSTAAACAECGAPAVVPIAGQI